LAGWGGVSLAAGCSAESEKFLYSLVQAPEDMVPGKATWYAATCRECPAGCGILARNREGRVVKIEGNPEHPINRGKICMRGQAALQGIYNPDRIKVPLLKKNGGWSPISFAEARRLLAAKAESAARKGRDRIGMLTEMTGESLRALIGAALKNWNSSPPLVFEPFSYDSLKAANRRILGIEGLVSYRLDRADCLVSFGADFLETWLSPVEYGTRFKEMHAIRSGRKNPFFHVGPYRSLTGANADLWLACNPGSEAVLAMSLVNAGLEQGRGKALPEDVAQTIREAAAPFTEASAVQAAGLSPERYRVLRKHLLAADRPLVLGTGTGTAAKHGFETDLAVNMLNLVLDPDLRLFDFIRRHAVEAAAGREAVLQYFEAADAGALDLLLLNNVNPVFALPTGRQIEHILQKESLFVVSLASFMDETAQASDLILPVRLPLETWDEYAGALGIVSMLQPAMGRMTEAPHAGDVFLPAAFPGDARAASGSGYKDYLYSRFLEKGLMKNPADWVAALRDGGKFDPPLPAEPVRKKPAIPPPEAFKELRPAAEAGLAFFAAPSIRFFDGRGANKPWLCEIPDELTQVAWQTPVRMHPETLGRYGLRQQDRVRIQSRFGSLEATVYETGSVKPDVLVMEIGQGHAAYGRYARGTGLNPYRILPFDPDPATGGALLAVSAVTVQRLEGRQKLAHLDGGRVQYSRKIALSVGVAELAAGKPEEKSGLGMHEFPFTLPLPEGYDRRRDFYPAHDHPEYRWSMVVDLDRCIGCNACAAACYAENNLGVVGEKRILEGREMAWLQVQRYVSTPQSAAVVFLPMLCQHCDNAPCESVCPVFAPHHNREGLNNQIYNRCIGTRFCSQNCPYKVRRFNWFDWKWPQPLNLQLNPDVTVRSKGVMEKCSFCVQRIKAAHDTAKNEQRKIRDGEFSPACVQTCPTGALVFGNLKDANSRVRRLTADPRAYQVMGYLNTKPAVIYLKKVVPEI